jgi:HK97 family phage major capsid protein
VTGNKVLIFGDHDRYLVRVVNEFATRILTERYADFDQNGLVGFLRIDGRLLDRSGKAINSAVLS